MGKYTFECINPHRLGRSSFRAKSLLFYMGLFLLFSLYTPALFSQKVFPDQCVGSWTGIMHIYQKGVLKDSVKIIFSVTPMVASSWSWKTQYISDKYPLTKDYILRQADSSAHRFVVDEGEGVLLYDYQFGNKLYAVFETHDVLLTSTYELIEDNVLVFEVTSGKKLAGKATDEVINYSVESLQKVVLRRQ